MTARILLVRDGDMPAATVERVLARDYAAVEVAKGFAAARAALADALFDLAVVGDSGDGAAAADFVRGLRLEPATEALPVVLAAHVLAPEKAAAGYAAGADAVIGPHPDTVLLGARLRFLLRHQALLDELRLREEASRSLGIKVGAEIEAAPLPRRLVVLTDDGRLAPELEIALRGAGFDVSAAVARPLGEVLPPDAAPEMVLVDVNRADPLAIAARFRRIDRRRTVAVAHEARDPFRAVRALELGLAEPLPRPLDPGATAAALTRMAERQALMERLRRRYAGSLDLAITDSLTGVFNRRYLDAYFELQARARGASAGSNGAAPAECPFALLLIDVDRFKEINDRLGHAVGDVALRLIAERLIGHVRTSDMVVRVGGEEFVVLMPGTDRATAETVAERLRVVVGEKPFVLGPEPLRVTISIGIAYGALAPADLLKEADAALYASKQKGRNCVTAAASKSQASLAAPAA
ncbi:MAG TPA: diguanylate cyclase [Alphaproteobacteria bacterium]|jgi:two-component system cell cycle response regulator